MKNNIAARTLGVFVLIASGIAFGQTQVPNTFQSGQPARATEVNDNFATIEAATNDNAAGVAANTAVIGNNTTEINAISAANQNLEARVLALEDQIAVLWDNLSPPPRVIVDSLGAILTPNLRNLQRWSLGGVDYNVHFSIPIPDPLTPREDLPITLELPQSLNGLASCTPSGPNTAYVVDYVVISPGAPASFSHSGVAYVYSMAGGDEPTSELFIDDFVADLSNLTFVQSFAADVGDTGIAATQLYRRPSDLMLECNQIGNVFLVGGYNIARFDLYTAPIISIGGLLHPPFTSVVP